MCVECYVVTAAIGVCLGLLLAWVTRTRRLGGVAAEIAVGVVGSVAMAWFLAPLAGNPASPRATTPEVIGALFGGLVVLAVYAAIALRAGRDRSWSTTTGALEQARADIDEQREHRGIEEIGEDAVQRADPAHRLRDERDIRGLA